jgi:uncharacterized protein YndB with AHSA1/START domain
MLHDPGSEPDQQVTRSVDVDADVAEVWRAVADPGERALWLDDADALARRVRVDECAPERRLAWTWWRPGDEGEASTVSVVLAPLDGGGTRVVVTESMPAHGPAPWLSARAAVLGSAPRRSPALVHCPWDHRLLGLELLFVAARAGVA